MRLERLAAFLAGLAAGQADLQDAALGEQRHALRRADDARPVAAAIGMHDLALGEALLACGGADRVLRFDRQQRFVAADHVQRRQLAACKMSVQLLDAQLHR
jgi:hypothetical protein